jgi:hypothetical protein
MKRFAVSMAKSALHALQGRPAPPPVELGGVAEPGKATGVLLLDAADALATPICAALAGLNVVVQRAAADLSGEDARAGECSLIIPCSARALASVASRAPEDPIRRKAMLPEQRSLESPLVRLQPGEADEGSVTVSCLYVYGRPVRAFLEGAEHGAGFDAECLGLARQALDSLRWHGFATVTVASGQVVAISPLLADSIAVAVAAGVNFPLALWRIARGESLDPQSAAIS